MEVALVELVVALVLVAIIAQLAIKITSTQSTLCLLLKIDVCSQMHKKIVNKILTNTSNDDDNNDNNSMKNNNNSIIAHRQPIIVVTNTCLIEHITYQNVHKYFTHQIIKAKCH